MTSSVQFFPAVIVLYLSLGVTLGDICTQSTGTFFSYENIYCDCGCCGSYPDEYCCTCINTGAVAGGVVSTIIIVAIIVVVIVVVIKHQNKKKVTVVQSQPAQPAVNVTHISY